MVILPFVPSVPFYRFSVLLGGTPYVFDVRWNSRAAQWYFDMSEEDGTAIVRGAAIALGAISGRTSSHPFMFTGVILARDTTQQNVDPTLDDLGTRVQVIYMTRDEMAAEIIADVIGSDA